MEEIMENEEKVLELTDVEFECIKNILKFSRDELKAHIENSNNILKKQESRVDSNTSNINRFTLNIFKRDIEVIEYILYKMKKCEARAKLKNKCNKSNAK